MNHEPMLRGKAAHLAEQATRVCHESFREKVWIHDCYLQRGGWVELYFFIIHVRYGVIGTIMFSKNFNRVRLFPGFSGKFKNKSIPLPITSTIEELISVALTTLKLEGK